MKDFAKLYRDLESSTSNLAKQSALQAYFRNVQSADAAWAVYFLAGGKPRQLVPTKLLKHLAQEAASLPDWLFAECYEAVGDLAETISLLLPHASSSSHAMGLAQWVEEQLLPLRGTSPEKLRTRLLQQWQWLESGERLPYFKLITGSMRVGVSRLQVTQALAALSGVDAKRIAQRLMGYTQPGLVPTAADYQALIALENAVEQNPQNDGRPYPFFLAHALNAQHTTFDTLLGDTQDWLVEWKWDGIRAQLVKRAGQVWIWSRGEELITDRYPELVQAAAALPDGTVLDGEILVWKHDQAQPFAVLQKRIGRKLVSKSMLTELPVVLMAYDLLEHRGVDQRPLAQTQRRYELEQLLSEKGSSVLRTSPILQGKNWTELAKQREAARAIGTEGFMLKKGDSAYGTGRTKDQGIWWKWKIDPMQVDAVLIYAQRGHGRRASLYSDYTFAVWSGPPEDAQRTLIPFAKAYSGLTDEEMARVDAIIRKTTREQFGPVRSVEPTLVFELGFEGIARSTRHKSGIAVRFPRMLRWRQDKPITQADSLQTLTALLPEGGA